jgi:di/tricarboxylate transporter
MDAYIVIGVLIFMIVTFIIGKWPYGLITMACCGILALTGVLDVSTAFMGFANRNLILLAGAFVVSDTFAKTSLIANLKKRILTMQNGKTGMLLMAIFVATIVLLGMFLPSPATLAIIIVLARNLSDDAELCPSRIILPAAALATLWTSRIPFGMGAVYFTRINAFIEPYGEEYSIGMFEPFKVAIIPLVVCSLYTILCYRLLPRQAVERPKEEILQTVESTMSRRDEIITYIVFTVMMLCMLFNKITGNLMYVVPAICALVLCFTKTITVDEAKKTLSSDIIFMLAGIYVLSDALSSTGAGEIIGEFILSLMGNVSSPLLLCAVFVGVSLILTNLMSNMATFNMLIPLAVSTALAAGVAPGPLATAVGIASTCACVLPCSSGESAMAYAASGYNMGKTFRFTIPFVLLFYVSLMASMMIFYY